MPRDVQWVAADGTTLTLTDRGAGYRVLAEGTSGLASPPYRYPPEQSAGIDGVDVRAVSADAREVVLGLIVEAPNEDLLALRQHALVRAMRPKAGPGRLVITSSAGQRRELTCRYTSGLEGSEDRGATTPGRWRKAAVHLLAADPWWYGEEQTISVGLGAGQPFFPILPMRLSPSNVQGSFTVDLSDADDVTHPVWTITGPGSSLVLTNETTGRSIQVDALLAPGETMIIDTRPGRRSVRRGDGALLTSSLVGDPSMWPLIEDVNEVSALLVGATSASRIRGVYRPKYAGA